MPEKTPTLAERAKSHAAGKRAQLAAEYRALLLRNEPEDVAALVDTMTALGRDPRNLNEDLALVQQLAEHERLAKREEKLQDELVRKHAALDKALRDSEQARKDLAKSIEDELAPLTAARAQAEERLTEAKQARAGLGLLRDKWTAVELGVDVEEVRAARRATLAAETPPNVHGPGVPQDK